MKDLMVEIARCFCKGGLCLQHGLGMVFYIATCSSKQGCFTLIYIYCTKMICFSCYLFFHPLQGWICFGGLRILKAISYILPAPQFAKSLHVARLVTSCQAALWVNHLTLSSTDCVLIQLFRTATFIGRSFHLFIFRKLNVLIISSSY